MAEMERPAWGLIADQIATAREELIGEAQALVKWYIEILNQAKRNLPQADQPKYFFKIKKKEKIISMYWVKSKFKKIGDKHVPLHKYIKCNGLYTYTKDAFSQAGEWELELILEIERRAKPIRRELALAAALSRVLSGRTGRKTNPQSGSDTFKGEL